MECVISECKKLNDPRPLFIQGEKLIIVNVKIIQLFVCMWLEKKGQVNLG